jgi:hypothetical protein
MDRYGAIESCGVKNSLRRDETFLQDHAGNRFFLREDAVFAIGETIKVGRVCGGSGKMNL